MAAEFAWLRGEPSGEGDGQRLLALGREQEAAGNLRIAATAYDRAFGLEPGNGAVARAREALLDRLAVEEVGIRFRYVPAGSFLMGSATGDPDEQPVHPVELSDYWMAETPLSWTDYCRLLGWSAPPEGLPLPEPRSRSWWRFFQRVKRDSEARYFRVEFENKIRLQYCEDWTLRADRDPSVHVPDELWLRRGAEPARVRARIGEPARQDPHRPFTYTEKPVVSVSWQDVQELGARISTAEVIYRLPTEAEWEKAARGGRIGCRYPWGNAPPSPDRCDYDRYEQFAIQPMRRFPPNGYGLYTMSGGVWEWTQDWYDASYYAESARKDPTGPPNGEEKVLRGGSWADCADTVTVSFRMSRKAESGGSPNIGFRLCRVKQQPTTR
jgi:formylglycine-generating enzyme